MCDYSLSKPEKKLKKLYIVCCRFLTPGGQATDSHSISWSVSIEQFVGPPMSLSKHDLPTLPISLDKDDSRC